MPEATGAPPLSLTEQIDALIASDERPLLLPRTELGAAVLSAGMLAGDAVALLALDGPGFHDRVHAALYDLLRLARSLDIDVDDGLTAEIRKRVDYRRRIAEHGDRAGAAADRARGA